jgi:hypothetical protein
MHGLHKAASLRGSQCQPQRSGETGRCMHALCLYAGLHCGNSNTGTLASGEIQEMRIGPPENSHFLVSSLTRYELCKLPAVETVIESLECNTYNKISVYSLLIQHTNMLIYTSVF